MYSRRQLITSALPYINGVKHLGNLVGSMLPADVHARFLRARGHDVLFVCATDEHGTPAELAAREAGLPVDEYCRRQHEVQADLARRFDLSFDHFGRSSSPQNRELTQHIASRLEANGFIEERATRQAYSATDGRFLPDRYVTGTCPHCGYTMARGDQCDGCTRLLDPTELKSPSSTVSGATDIEFLETKHLFLLLPKLAQEVRDWISRYEGKWPVLTTSTASKWLNEGLQDRSITRDLKWGIPVDRPGFENKVFYVWFDAPIEYIAATKEWADERPGERDWRSWWWQADDVDYTQFMAKDNLPFHTIMFPAMLLGTQEPWRTATYIKGFNWLTYLGGKFSTSRRRGVFMDAAIELLPSDYWRFALMANCPESSDADFSWEALATAVNKALADKLGNFVNRVLKFAHSKMGDSIPAGGESTDLERQLTDELGRRIADYTSHLESLSYRKAMAELVAIWTAGNVYFETAAPWKTVTTDPIRAQTVIRHAINLVRVFAIVSAPIVPATAEKMFAALRATEAERRWFSRPIGEELATLAPGRTYLLPEVLIRKLADEEVAGWQERFSGVAEPTSVVVD
jgi:methionyl-tRNA synthetase